MATGNVQACRPGPQSLELVGGMPLRNWVRYNAGKGGWDAKVTRDAPFFPREASAGGRLPGLTFFTSRTPSVGGSREAALRSG